MAMRYAIDARLERIFEAEEPRYRLLQLRCSRVSRNQT